MNRYERMERDDKVMDCAMAGYVAGGFLSVATMVIGILVTEPMEHEIRMHLAPYFGVASVVLAAIGAPVGWLIGTIRHPTH